MASASASAASAGRGGSASRSSLVTIVVTCSLSARPLPVTAALTSLGVCRATGSPRRAAHTMATAPAWAVPITVRTLCWLNTRSTATASGWCSVSQASNCSSRASSRRLISSSAGVRATPTLTRVSARPGVPSTTPSPQRARPGAMPKTRIGRWEDLSAFMPPPDWTNTAAEHLFGIEPTGSEAVEQEGRAAEGPVQFAVGGGVAAGGQPGQPQRGHGGSRVQRGQPAGPDGQRVGGLGGVDQGAPAAGDRQLEQAGVAVAGFVLDGQRHAQLSREREAAAPDGLGHVDQAQHTQLVVLQVGVRL